MVLEQKVRERGISFTAWSIPKILDGTKTMTRRTWGLEEINKHPDVWCNPINIAANIWQFENIYDAGFLFYVKCPYGQPGDRLWVKEIWTPDPFHPDETLYKANTNEYIEEVLKSQLVKWKSPRFMPRRASRKDLDIADVRAERLQGITAGDALAEGIASKGMSWDWVYDEGMIEGRNFSGLPTQGYAERWYIGQYARLWDSINAKRYPWDFNPWVWPIGWQFREKCIL